MERNNNTTKVRKGKHLTYDERQKLEVLLKAKVERRKIAELLGGRSERTIRREIERGTVQRLNSDLTAWSRTGASSITVFLKTGQLKLQFANLKRHKNSG